MQLKIQKRLAGQILKSSQNDIWLDSDRLDEIKEAITKADIKSLIKDAKAIEEAGAFALVVEGVKPKAAKEITKAVSIPTIGIGAGAETDGQVLVWSDMLGFFEDFKPKFVKRYLDGAKLIREALIEYKKDVKEGKFPTDEFSYN